MLTDQSRKVFEGIVFENWIRFYFMVEENEDLKIEIPVKEIKKIEASHPEFLALAQKMNGRNVDILLSRSAVLEYALGCCHNDANILEAILNDHDFQEESGIFGEWEKANELSLAKKEPDFGAWLALYFRQKAQ